MSRREPASLDCKVYVGELGSNGTREALEDAFGYYGPLKEVWVARNPPGFAFIMFHDSRDARDAVRALDGKIICGRRVKVELSTGKSRHDKPGGGRGFRGPPGPPGRFRDSPPRRMESRYPYGGGGGGRDRRGNGYDDGRYPRHRYSSRSRSRSPSPPMPRGRPRTPPSRSRSRTPPMGGLGRHM